MITLLNGDVWNETEILTQMYSDDFYYGHLNKNALSSSSLKTLLKSPKTYRNVIKYGSQDTQALSEGRLAHWFILEPHKIDDLHFVDASTKNTNKYKDAKKEYEHVFLTKEREAAERLADAVLRNEAALKLLSKSEFETPAIQMINGLPFRGKADILQDDAIIDLKTTADLNTFRYSADKYGYDLQAWLYLKLFNKSKFIFLVVDKGSTDIGIFDVSDEFLNRGEQKFHQAVDNYTYFFKEEHDLDQYVLRGVL